MSREIEVRLDTALLQLVRRERAKSIEDVWCAALACVMHRYDPSSCSPIRIGRSAPTPTNRPHCDDAIADLILAFITSTRVAEVQFNENTTFTEVLKAMIPADTELGFPAEGMQTLAKRNLLSLRPALPVVFGSYRSSRVTAAGCDLAFSLEPGKGLTLQYNTFRFTRGGANRVLGHVFGLLADAIQNPSESLGNLQLLTENERESMTGWNISGSDYPGDRCLHELYEDEVEQRGETTALVAGGTDISFENLNRHAEQIAWYLAHNGAGRGTLVAIYGEPGFDFIGGMLGVWKTGGICIPIDSRMPEEQVGAILTAARPALIVCRQTEPHLRHEFLRTIELKSLPPAGFASPVDSGARPPVTPDEIATIVFPAGRNGPLRGVMSSHRALINRLAWVWRVHPFDRGEIAGSRAIANTSVFPFEVFSPLLAGTPVVFFDSAITKEPRQFLEALATSRITRVVSQPVVLEDVVRERETAGDELPDLRLWLTIGGPLRVHTARRFQALFGGATLLNAFGSSETTGLATSFETRQMPTDSLVVPAGLPLANTKIRVVDENRQDTPIGIPGEVWIGGDSLARGYLNDPDGTAESFPSEAAEGGGELRWFRTGEIGKFLPSGEIEMVGRIDEAIEIDGVRGHRGEIERMLRAHSEVDRAAVRVSRAP
ncbi:MAG: amino acid adenylation domain-containing protein, partial [Verrucomicrobiales bacterium]